jgi:hypothetical protein
VEFAAFSPDAPPLLEFKVLGDAVALPQYRLSVAEAGDTAADVAAGAAGDEQRAAPDDAGVVLAALSAAVLRVGHVSVLDACDAWMLDKVEAVGRRGVRRGQNQASACAAQARLVGRGSGKPAFLRCIQRCVPTAPPHARPH